MPDMSSESMISQYSTCYQNQSDERVVSRVFREEQLVKVYFHPF